MAYMLLMDRRKRGLLEREGDLNKSFISYGHLGITFNPIL